MKFIIIVLAAALVMSACATRPEGSRPYVGRIECWPDFRLLFFETVYAVNEGDAREEINKRLNTYNVYHESGYCSLVKLTPQ